MWWGASGHGWNIIPLSEYHNKPDDRGSDKSGLREIAVLVMMLTIMMNNVRCTDGNDGNDVRTVLIMVRITTIVPETFPTIWNSKIPEIMMMTMMMLMRVGVWLYQINHLQSNIFTYVARHSLPFIVVWLSHK